MNKIEENKIIQPTNEAPCFFLQYDYNKSPEYTSLPKTQNLAELTQSYELLIDKIYFPGNEIKIVQKSSVVNVTSDKFRYFSKKKRIRYFDTIDSDMDLHLKCKICSERGHTEKNCIHKFESFCLMCCKYGHKYCQCPEIQCYKCNEFGHIGRNCKNTLQTQVTCSSCGNIGHTDLDCLIKPKSITLDSIIDNNLNCICCGNKTHLICEPLKLKENKKSVNDLDIEEIKVPNKK